MYLDDAKNHHDQAQQGEYAARVRSLSHRALAAPMPMRRRSSGAVVVRRRLPPILPPVRPIAAMTRDMSDLVTIAGRSVDSSVEVAR